MNKISLIILRLVVVIAALSYVFKETGWATVVLFSILLIQTEITGIVVTILIKERNVSSQG